MRLLYTLRTVIFLISTLSCALAYAQDLKAKKTTDPIIIDGIFDEPAWQEADIANNFRQFFPSDSVPANYQTQVRILYDENFIYIAAKMEGRTGRKYITPSLRRDFRGEGNDGLTILFDTFQDRTNGFAFGINPFGVQREGLVANGGNSGEDLSFNWDNKWYSEAKIFDDYWTAEIAIPFKSIRFKDNAQQWNVNFYRIDSDGAERSTWSPIPRNFDIVTLAFGKPLVFEHPLKKTGTNISVIPYTSGGLDKNYIENTPTNKNLNIGFDAKIGISSSLNLDVTVNPDFSQVEVDEQVTNLDRFEIFFPERRQFFLENADLFSNFGFDGTRPFFSRRIGVARDTATGQNIQNTIYGGVRLSGKLDNNWRIGLLSMQGGEDVSIGLPSTNYTVASIQRKVFHRSNIGLIYVNKQAFQDSIDGSLKVSPEQFNRLLGMDFNLASKNNVWNGKVFYHRSFQNATLDSAYATGASINYNTLRWSVSLFTRNVGANYNPEVGFVRRKDIMQLAHTTWYNFYPKSSTIQSHGPGFDFDMVGNKTYGFLDWDVNLMYRMRFKNTLSWNIRLRKEYTYLFNSFDPTQTDGVELPANTDYTNNVFIGNFSSDARKRFIVNLSTRSGGYFNGTRVNLSGSLLYRYIPFGFTSLNFSFNRLQLPQPYNSANLVLIGPRFDITLSRNLFFTTFFQYNSQIKNININSRLQWRFKPVSDFFIVYSDNYVTETFTDNEGQTYIQGQPRLRGIVFKLSYWINM